MSGVDPGSPVCCGCFTSFLRSREMDSRICTGEVSAVAEPKNANVKTLGVKLADGLHAQFSLVAQLDDLSLADAVLEAVALYVKTKQAAPDFQARATAKLEEIEREAASRRDAIQALLGGSDESGTNTTTRKSRS